MITSDLVQYPYYEQHGGITVDTLSVLRKIASFLALVNPDIRRDVFIGLTGLFIAILVFVAGALAKESFEVRRKSYIHYLKPFSKMLIVTITLFLVIFAQRKTFFSTSNEACLLRFILLELVIDLGIVISFSNSLKLFWCSLNIISQHRVASQQLLKYIVNRADDIEATVKKETSKFKKQKSLKSVCENYPTCVFQEYVFSRDGYIPVYAHSKGHITAINFDILRNMSLALIKAGKASNEEKIIIFTKDIGNSVDTVTPIAYVLESRKSLSANISSAFTISSKLTITIGEYDIIHNDLLAMSKEKDFSGFQRGEIIYQYIEYLYQHNYETALDDFFSKLTETYRTVSNHTLNIAYTRALSWVAIISKKNNINHYQQICGLIKWLYLHRKDAYGNNPKRIACDYMNQFFLMDSLDSINEKNCVCFSIIMGDLFSLAREFIKVDALDAIEILFNESHFDYNEKICKDSTFACSLFQFSVGITHALMLQYNNSEHNISIQNQKSINNIYSFIKDHFVGYLDVNDIIKKHINYYYEKSAIQDVYSGLELDFSKSAYSYSSSATGIDPNLILISMMVLLNIDYSYANTINESLVSPERKYSYEHMIRQVDAVKDSLLIKKLRSEYNFKNLKNCLQKLYDLSMQNHTNQLISTPLDANLLSSLYNLIGEKFKYEDSILHDFYSLNKVQQTQTSSNSYLSSSFHVSRDFFFESTNENNMIANELIRTLLYQLDIKLSDAIKSNCIEKDIDEFESVILKLSKPEEYVLIADSYSKHTIKQDRPTAQKFIDKKKIEVITSRSIDGLLLVRKHSIPDIRITIPKNTNDIGIKCGESLYCKVTDYVNNPDALDKAIANNEWLKEIGNEEKQREYLLQRCLVELSYFIEIPHDTFCEGYLFI